MGIQSITFSPLIAFAVLAMLKIFSFTVTVYALLETIATVPFSILVMVIVAISSWLLAILTAKQ